VLLLLFLTEAMMSFAEMIDSVLRSGRIWGWGTERCRLPTATAATVAAAAPAVE